MNRNSVFGILLCLLAIPACQCNERKPDQHEAVDPHQERVPTGWYAPDTSVLEKEFGDCLHDESNCFTLYFEYPTFRDTGLGPSLNAMVNFFLIGDWKDSVSSIQELADVYGQAFTPNTNLGGGSWQVEKVMNLLHQDSLIISFYLEELENLGGANPELRGSYLNVDKLESRVLELKDFLNQPYQSKLESLALEYYSKGKVADLENTKQAQDGSTNLDLQQLELNFGIGPNGIHFLIEDADQPKGIFEFIIPYSRLQSEGLLKNRVI